MLKIVDKYLMKHVLITFLIIFSANSFARYIDIVFDIDWTLVYPVNDISKIEDTSRLFHVNGEYYRLADGAEEIIDDLLKNKNVRISFFSGGVESRNVNLLKSINLPNSNKSLYEISHKVLSKKDLSVVSTNQELKFFERYKKDMRLVSKDLDNIVLLDDLKKFTPKAQRSNILWMGDTYEFTDKFNKKLGGQFYPSSKLLWGNERNKLFWAFDQLDHAIKESTKNKTSLVHEMNNYKKQFKMDDNAKMRKAIVKMNQLKKTYPNLTKINTRSFCNIWF